MYKTIFFSLLLLAVAFGGPISMFRFSDFWRELRKNTFGGTSINATSVDAGSPETAKEGEKTFDAFTTSANTSALSLEGSPTPALEEVLRFDIAPAWVLQRWPRVSTDLAQLQLQGYRVPLVTGTDKSDVAGSLTYYFNSAQKVRLITLKATTGDPRPLIALLNSRYGFVRRANNDPSRLVFESINAQGQALGSMVIQSASVVRADRPYQRYSIDLTLDRPG
ncbi:MAG: DUF6690 family protein [Thermoguttaceae bacterium]